MASFAIMSKMGEMARKKFSKTWRKNRNFDSSNRWACEKFKALAEFEASKMSQRDLEKAFYENQKCQCKFWMR